MNKTIVMRGGAVPHALKTAAKALNDVNVYLNQNITMGGKTTSQVRGQVKKIDKAIANVQKMIDKASNTHSPMEEETNMDTKQFMDFANAINEVHENLDENKKMEKMMDFIGDKLENSNMDVDQLKKAFVKKFGRSAEKHYQSILSNFLD